MLVGENGGKRGEMKVKVWCFTLKIHGIRSNLLS